MEDVSSSVAEVVESSAPVVESAPAPEVSEAPAIKVDAKSAAPAEVSAEPAYQPNFKFKSWDKEHEIPPAFRSIIKDAETEKQVREIFEKATGIEHIKAERTQTREELKQYRAQTEPLVNIAQELHHYRQKGDMGSYFAKLGLSNQDILKYAVDYLKREELPPEQKRVYDEREAANRQMYQREQEFASMQSQLQEVRIQQRSTDLQNALSSPTVQSYVQAFDQRNGQNAFWDEVVARGQMYWHSQQKDVPPAQIVQEIMERFGAQGHAQVPQASMVAAPRQPTKVPTIPNTGSGGSSPGQRTIRSIDDLKKVANEKFAE